QVIPLEFQLVPSSTEHEAACRNIVASGKLEDAESLWKALVGRAESARLAGATITLGGLWAEGPSRFHRLGRSFDITERRLRRGHRNRPAEWQSIYEERSRFQPDGGC